MTPALEPEKPKSIIRRTANGKVSVAAEAMDYVPLPDAVKNQIRATWKSNVKDASGKVVYNQ